MPPKVLEALPAELAALKPEIIIRALPDVSVTVLKEEKVPPNCHRIKFEISYRAGAFSRPGWLQIPVEIRDTLSKDPPIRMTVPLPSSGGKKTILLDWFMAASDAKFDPDYNTVLSVTADPDHTMFERTTGNNTAKQDSICIG